MQFECKICYLGDDALLIDFGNTINLQLNQYIVQVGHAIESANIPGILELVLAYASITIYCNAHESSIEIQREKIESIINHHNFQKQQSEKEVIKIPVCYENEFAPDIQLLASEKQVTIDDVIRLHTERIYHVYMIGFLPGFAYMGEVNKKIQLGRKLLPNPIVAGSVGVAGKQTGIYPLSSPGGWNIIGRTPVTLFQHNKTPPCFLQAGDSVQFYPITTHEFNHY